MCTKVEKYTVANVVVFYFTRTMRFLAINIELFRPLRVLTWRLKGRGPISLVTHHMRQVHLPAWLRLVFIYLGRKSWTYVHDLCLWTGRLCEANAGSLLLNSFFFTSFGCVIVLVVGWRLELNWISNRFLLGQLNEKFTVLLTPSNFWL